MPQYIDLNIFEQNEILVRTSAQTKISPLLIEKDFWVTWLLKIIFQIEQSKILVFKGGTSLSKCYRLINRFSEDIDITMDKNAFSQNTSVPSSGKQFQKMLKANDKQAIDFVNNILKKELEAAIEKHIPKDSWRLETDKDEPKNLRFHYPSCLTLQDEVYVKQSILLEAGIRGEIYPCEEKQITSYIEQSFSNLDTGPITNIRTLSPIRTFWEKITLLHAENKRPEDKKIGDRMSRHYYDTHQLIHAQIAEKSMARMDLLTDVIKNKSIYFRSSWAQYETAIPGQLQIYPNDRLLEILRNDYKQMQLMIFGDIPSFDQILNSIKQFEDSFNAFS